MAQSIREVMTDNPCTVERNDSLVEAARIMRDAGVGAVLVVEDDHVVGILTDRDIVVRAVAEGRNPHIDPDTTTAGEICTTDLTAVRPDEPVEDAIELMREKDVRRLPVVESRGRPAGIVSLGDLAVEHDPDSVLADISAAAPNN